MSLVVPHIFLQLQLQHKYFNTAYLVQGIKMFQKAIFYYLFVFVLYYYGLWFFLIKLLYILEL